jgi:hypothetical protein
MSLAGTESQFDASMGRGEAPRAFAAAALRPERGAAGENLAWHLVKTHKSRPLRFRGERIIRMATEPGEADVPAHEIDLFLTEADTFVVVLNRLGAAGARHPLSVFEAASATEIRAHVAKIDPLPGLPIPLDIIENKSIGEMLEAHENLARRIQAIRQDLGALCEMALAPLS